MGTSKNLIRTSLRGRYDRSNLNPDPEYSGRESILHLPDCVIQAGKIASHFVPHGSQ